MAQPLELFFDRFLKFNRNRYQNDPVMLAAINALTFTDLQFDNIQITALPDGRDTIDLDMFAGQFLQALDQKYTTAEVFSKPVVNRAEVDPVDYADLSTKSLEGVYVYEDNGVLKGAVVIHPGKDKAEDGIAILRLSCKYDISDEELFTQVADGETQIVVATRTFTGILTVIEGVAADFFYDGTYTYNGEITY